MSISILLLRQSTTLHHRLHLLTPSLIQHFHRHCWNHDVEARCALPPCGSGGGVATGALCCALLRQHRPPDYTTLILEFSVMHSK